MKSKFVYGERVKITEEAAELICSREADVDFDFNQGGVIKDQSTIGKHKMYEVKFDNGQVFTLPQSYLEKIEEEYE